MSFVKVIRKHCRNKYKDSHIKIPTEDNFSIANWNLAFRTHGDGTIQDRRLYEAGLWFYKRLKILEIKRFRFFREDIQKNLIRLQVGSINWDVKDIELNLHGWMNFNKDKGISISNISEFSAYTEHLIDSACLAISSVYEEKDFDDHSKITQLQEWLEQTRTYSICLGGLSNLFQECLWSNWFVGNSYETNKDIDIVQPSNANITENYKINLLRWESVALAGLGLEWWHDTSDEIKKNIFELLPSRIYGEMNDQTGEVRLKIGRFKIDPKKGPPFEAFADALLRKNTFFPERFYEEPLAKMEHLSLYQFFLVWGLISSLAEDLYSNLVHDPKQYNVLLKYGPFFSRSDLENMLKEILFLNQDQASKIIELLIFKDESCDLWCQPLVKVGDNSLTIVFRACLSSNPIRLASYFLHKAQFDMRDKGVRFEVFTPERLIQKNKLKNVKISPMSFEFYDEDRKRRDIDLILKIGSIILVCETKCSLFPVEPCQIYNYYEFLKDGALQAKISLKYVENNLQSFMKRLGFNDLDSLSKIKILPVVVSNLPLATGLNFNDVPVIDLRVLEQFIGDGKYVKYSCSMPDGLQPFEEIKLYTSEKEAEEYIEEYLHKPPQIEMYKQDVIWRKIPIDLSDCDFNPAYTSKVDVNVPMYSSLIEKTNSEQL